MLIIRDFKDVREAFISSRELMTFQMLDANISFETL